MIYSILDPVTKDLKFFPDFGAYHEEVTKYGGEGELLKTQRVALDILTVDGVDYRVSTMTLMFGHYHNGSEDHYFETMVFKKGSSRDLYMDRYKTYGEARRGHRKALEKLKNGEIKDGV
jgi:hypothetical protein